MNTYVINGKKMLDKKQAFAYLQKTLHLPDYLHNNLDSLNDCLNECCYQKNIIILHKQSIIDNLGDYGLSLLKVFQDNSEKGILNLIF